MIRWRRKAGAAPDDPVSKTAYAGAPVDADVRPSGAAGGQPSSPAAVFEAVEETPHEDYPIEWWFFQGGFASPDGAEYEFMVAFFRLDTSPESAPVENGCCLLVTLLEVATGTNYVLSQVDRVAVAGLLRRIELLDETEIDRELAGVLYKEIERHGPPRPVRVHEGPVRIAADRLSISWDDLLIEQDGHVFVVTFTVPERGSRVSLRLMPEYPRILWQSDEKNESLSSEMMYATYPRMTLVGQMDEQEVRGTAWSDHQWGEYCWFVADDPKKQVVGWDWFGLNLADGTDVVVSVVYRMRGREVAFARALVRRPGAEPLEYGDVRVTAQRHWESPRTHIVYPVECRIEIPGLGLDVVYRPLLDDQEIALIGVARAGWEGAGRVAGSMDGAPVSGRARAEFYGYGYIYDFEQHVRTLADRVDKHIEGFFPKRFTEADVTRFVGKAHWRHEPEAYTRLLSTPVWDLLTRPGKRWRPIFGILMGEALGALAQNYEASACLAELVHSGALIIDDVEDESLLRRGEPSLHLKYGVDVAINAGNTLFFLPTVELFDHKYLDDAKKLRIHEIMMKTYLQAHFGQTVDIYWSRYLTRENLEVWLEEPLEDKILQQYDYKTAAGAKGLAETAAVVAEADEAVTEACIDFARAFAVAFQIVDDVHNFSDSPKWTKVPGEDLAAGKLTYLIVRAIRALGESDGAKRNRLVEILCSPEERKTLANLQEGIRLVRESGAIAECHETARSMSLAGNERFSAVVPSCEPKIMLSMLCLKMLDLAYDT